MLSYKKQEGYSIKLLQLRHFIADSVERIANRVASFDNGGWCGKNSQ